MNLPARSRRTLDERRAQLLELGLRLFGARAYDEVSIEDIAAEAGISKGLLYHYFGSKRGFYVAIVGSAAAELAERTEPDPKAPPEERVRRGIEAYLAFVEERAGAYVSLMRGGIGTDPEVAAILEATRETMLRRILEGIGLAAPRPVFRLALRAWIGSVEAASLEWLERKAVPLDALVRVLTETLMATIAVALRVDPDAPVELDAAGRSPAVRRRRR